MSTATERRYPFPEASRPLLKVWTRAAAEIAVRHGDEHARAGADGLSDPVGPRQWRDGGHVGYKVFLVYFLSVDGKKVNHHLSVEFTADRTLIFGGNLGCHIELGRPSYTRETFEEDLRLAARFVGLLP